MNIRFGKSWFSSYCALLLVCLLTGAVGCHQFLPEKRDYEALNGQLKDEVVRRNMRAVQAAAEHFAADHGNKYPTKIDEDFRTYFPGGTDGRMPAAVGPVNPFTAANTFPIIGDVIDVRAVRYGPRYPMDPGVIEYSPLGNGAGYAITGGAHDGKALEDVYHRQQVLVFTNVTVHPEQATRPEQAADPAARALTQPPASAAVAPESAR
jgi:hypothetical protein